MLLEEFLQLFLWTFDFHDHFCHVFFAKVSLDPFPAADVFLFQSKQQLDLNTAILEESGENFILREAEERAAVERERETCWMPE